MADPEEEKSPLKKRSETARILVRFSGLGIQMMAIIVVCLLLGNFIDGRTESEFPTWTLVLTLFGIVGALYFLFKETSGKQ